MRLNPVLGLTLLLLLPFATANAQGPPPPLTPLPPPPQPAGNPITTAKAFLGKALFWDEQLSSTRTVACGSCHQPARGGSDPRSIAGSTRATNPGLDGIRGTADDIIGSPGVPLNDATGAFAWSPTFGLLEQVGTRLAPSFVNSAYAPELFWDGRAGQVFLDPDNGSTVLAAGGALENQILAPPVSTAEMGHIGRSWIDVAARVSGTQPLMLAAHIPTDLASWIGARSYPELFAEAFGTASVTGARIALAIASYERTLFATQTPFDSVIAGSATLTPQEAQGMQLFGNLGCAGCHAGALMSDQQYHYIGVRPATEDAGREGVTGLAADQGAFRTPSLRNVGLRPSYMHDGRFSTLEDVVEFYNRGGDFTAPNKPPAIHPLNLTAAQKAALLAFLRRPLTDPRVARESAPFDRPTLYTESVFVPQVLSGGIAGGTGMPPTPIALEPALAGNPQFTVGVYGGLGGAPAVLVLDRAIPPLGSGIPATGSFARISTLLQGSGANGGYGSATFAIPADTSIYGKTFFGRWYVSDASASGGVSASPAFQFTAFGPHGIASAALAVNTANPPTNVRLSPGWPNPFTSHTTVRFDLGITSRTRLVVYDVGGRVVRQLFDRATAAPGSYTIDWDGRDDAGRTVAAGVYFYRLDTDRSASSARVARIH